MHWIAASTRYAVGLALLIAAGLLLPFDLLGRGLRRFSQRPPERPHVGADSEPLSSSVVESPPEPVLPAAVQPSPPTLTRRELVERSYVGLAVGSGAATALYGVAFGRHDYVVEDVPIPIRNLPRSLDGYTIVQLSDLHVGVFVGDRELNASVELVRRARPDLVVLTGDLVDHDAAFVPQLARFTRRLVELGARDGVVAVPGNPRADAGSGLVVGRRAER